MMHKRNFVAVAATVLMLSSVGAATAQESPVIEPEATPARAERNHSINLDIGALAGTPSLTYEYMWTRDRALVLDVRFMYLPYQGHGRTVIGGVIGVMLDASGLRETSRDEGSGGIGAAIGYRRYWRQRQHSEFFGLHAGNDIGDSVIDGTDIARATHQTFYVAGNIGKRWLMRNNFNITARIGAGYAHRSCQEDHSPCSQYHHPGTFPQVRFLDELLDQFPATVDGELSVGYTF